MDANRTWKMRKCPPEQSRHPQHMTVVRDVLNDARYAPWREEALRRGYASVISLPVRVNGIVTGALTIYAAEPEAFDDEERRLLVDTAAGLGFGISH